LKKFRKSNLTKILTVAADLFPVADERTDRHDKTYSRFFAILRTRLKTTYKMQLENYDNVLHYHHRIAM